MLPRWNVPLQSDNHMKSCSLLLWPILPGIVYIAVALIRKVSGTALDGGDIDVRMKNWLDWLDKLFLITLIISTSHSCLRLRSCNPCFHWPYSILGNSFLFMCFASISISTGHPFLTIISSVFTLHFSWYILFSAAGGHELQHVGVLAAELQLRCSVFDDLNTIWVNVREEILQVLLVPHAVKHHGIVHDSKFPFHIYTLFQDFARCLWGIQATICETACVLKFKSSHAAGLGLEHEIISIWLVATRYCIVVFVPNTGCPQPRRMNLNLNLFLFQLASGLRSLYRWRIWFSKVQRFVGNSAFAPASLVSSVVALGWPLFFVFLSIDYFACWLWNSKCFLTSSTSVGFEPTCWRQSLQYVYRFLTERLVINFDGTVFLLRTQADKFPKCGHCPFTANNLLLGLVPQHKNARLLLLHHQQGPRCWSSSRTKFWLPKMAWPLSLGPVCSGNGMFFMFKENPVLATFFAKKTKLIVFRYVAGCFCAGVFFCIRMFSLHEGPWISLVEGGWKSPWSHPNSNERNCCAHVLPFHSKQETSISDCDTSPVYLASMSCSAAQCWEHSGPTYRYHSLMKPTTFSIDAVVANQVKHQRANRYNFAFFVAIPVVITVMNPRCVWHLATIFYCQLMAVWYIFCVPWPLAKY